MILYKLTTRDNLTRKGKTGETEWGPNVTHTAKGKGSALCSAAVIHAYTGAALALMMNPVHVSCLIDQTHCSLNQNKGERL